MGLYNRGTSYYEVINIPRDLIPIFNKKQIWVSLHTQQKTIAKIRSAMILSRINRQFIIERQKMAIFSDEPDDAPRLKIYYELFSTTQDSLDYDDKEIEFFALDFCNEKTLKDLPKLSREIQTLSYYQFLLNDYISAYKLHDYSFAKDAVDAYIVTHKISKPTENCYSKFLKSFMLAYIQHLEMAINHLKGVELKRPKELITDLPSTEQPNISYIPPQQINSLTAHRTKPDITLIELAEIYNNAKSRSNVADDHKAKILQRLTIWDNLLLHKKLNSITTEDVQKLVSELEYLPYRLSINQAHLDLLSIIQKNKNNPKAKCASFDTQIDYIKTLKSALRWAVMHKYVAENVIDAVDIPAPPKNQPDNKYRAYTIEELNLIIHSEIFTKHWGNHTKNGILRWLILLGMFTGARLNELCQLCVSDIREENGVSYISINLENDKKAKTKAAIRNIPIHNELIKLGFLSYVDTIRKEKGKQLFSGLAVNKRMSDQPTKWYGRFLDALGLTDKKLVFHSYRHLVREITRDNNIRSDVIERICGWESESSSLSEHYGNISLKLLADEFNEKLVYEGLDLNHLYV
ncbi:MAG: site-specific integrase [Alphaproteobacteria bacterium]|nr:site-specific integrase [Alphaproteobacteria bacterium]